MEDVARKRKLETKESKPAKKVRVESEREDSESMEKGFREKTAEKLDQKNDGFLDRSWKGSWTPKVILMLKNPPVLGPRGGVGKG